jgi:ribosome-associated protein
MTNEPNLAFCKITEQSLEDSKAQNITKLELFNKSSLCDYMFIATGTSSRHVHSICVNLKKEFKKVGLKHIDMEESGESNWVVLDAGDVLVHVFQTEAREKYKLEELWSNNGRRKDKEEE